MSLRIAAVLVLTVAGLAQSACACSECKVLTKDDKAMLLSHSEACMSESNADPKLVANLFKGEVTDDPALKKHVYCILLKCKMISKDGKLQKTALLGKVPKFVDSSVVTKALESCVETNGETPADIAWNFFKCGLEKKNILLGDGFPVGASEKTEQAGSPPETGSGTPRDPQHSGEGLIGRSI